MPFVFLGAVAVTMAYVVRRRRLEIASGVPGLFAPRGIHSDPVTGPSPVGVGGWLLVYMIGLAAQLAHNLALTIGSLVVYAEPSLVGLHSFIPLWAVLIYVVSNLALLAYGALLFVLMSRGRKTAIANNILFNVLSVAFLVIWFLLSAKSPAGTVVDALPGLAAIAYFSRSRRVRNTFNTAATIDAPRPAVEPIDALDDLGADSRRERGL